MIVTFYFLFDSPCACMWPCLSVLKRTVASMMAMTMLYRYLRAEDLASSNDDIRAFIKKTTPAAGAAAKY